jgi:ketosteroid isomerase-like protein
MQSLLPYLPESDVEFVYPGRPAIKSVDELTTYGDKVAQTVDRTAHFLGDVQVRELADGRYEILCMHTYEAIPKGGAPMAMSLVGRMQVQLGVKTSRDPKGANPKVVAYKVTPTGMPVPGVLLPTRKEFPTVASQPVLASENDVKAFVYDWFALIDAGDSASLGALVVDKDLDVDILGSKINDSQQFRSFLQSQETQQRWHTHVPLDLRVDMSTPATPTVRFLLHFDGVLANGTRMQLSNITTWGLKLDQGRLKLQSYRLAIL